MTPTKTQEALLIAQGLARQAKSAVDLHNAFFGVGGKFAELFPTRAEREAFAKTPEYQEILRLRTLLAQSEPCRERHDSAPQTQSIGVCDGTLKQSP